MRLRYIFFAFIVFLSLWHFADEWPSPTIGILAPDLPVQAPLAEREKASWNFRDMRITPLARYAIKARLLHCEPYWLDGGAKVSPLDFALGWRQMSDPAIYGKLHIGQGSRWYTWFWWGTPPIDDDEIPLLSANTHLIPAAGEVRRQLSHLRAGDVIQLSGYLVRVDGPGGWSWQSSLTRADTGEGSCELMWVKKANKVGR